MRNNYRHRKENRFSFIPSKNLPSRNFLRYQRYLREIYALVRKANLCNLCNPWTVKKNTRGQ